MNCGKMTATELSKQQELNADPRAMEQTSFTANLNRHSSVDRNLHWHRSTYSNIITSNKEINDAMNVVKSLEQLKMKQIKQKRGFLRILLGLLGGSLFPNLLTGKSKIGAEENKIRAGQHF